MKPEIAMRLLQEVGIAEASGEIILRVDLEGLFDVEDSEVEEHVSALNLTGLALFSYTEPPMLLDAGKQYLARRGQVPDPVLRFLPGVVDDLYAREALLAAGTILVDELAVAIKEGRAVEHAQGLVPPAFARAIDERTAIRFHAAAAALMARLAAGDPAGCLAEEILAVELLELAEV